MNPGLKVEVAKTKREKTLLFVLVIIAIVGIYFYIFLRPLITRLSELLPKVTNLDSQLNEVRYLINNKPLIEKENANLKNRIEKCSRTFPRQHEMQKFLENLSNVAGESNVKIVGIRPVKKQMKETEDKSRHYEEFPIEIIAKSGYHQFGKFLQKLEGQERFIMVRDLEVVSNPDDIKRHSIRMLISTYILTEEE